MSEHTSIITYQQLLNDLEKSDNLCHLLLGNGFNNSLGFDTSYKEIFDRMKRDFKVYELLEDYLGNNCYDIEALIRELKKQITYDDGITGDFLPYFIESKVKFDFMKAAYEIVKKEIKNIYQKEKNEGVHLLFKNFTNYFSLNYDPFLYLILMKFKKPDNNDQLLAFQKQSLFKEQDLDRNQNNIYTEILEARNEWSMKIFSQDSEGSENKLKKVTKTLFIQLISDHFKNKKWKSKDIKRVCNYIWEKESQEEKLNNINDSFLGNEYKPDYASFQNIFFLHGAFHIYRNKKNIYKITQAKNKALYQRLADIINSEEEDILCVLTGTSEEKHAAILENEYLSNNLRKLSSLEGTLVIFGSSLDENDKHIFKQVNHSKISLIYISSSKDCVDDYYKKAKKFFPHKQVTMFDYNTVSYKRVKN